MNHVEGLAINPNGSAVYAAAAFSSAVDFLARDASTGALSQSGCVTDSKVSGCSLGYEFGGVNALSFAPTGGDVYATSLTSNSLTTFRTLLGGVGISQPPGPERQVEKEKGPGKETVPAAEGTPSPDGCTVFLRSPGCGFGRAMQAPEGLDVSPDGTSIYVAAFQTGAIDVFDRDAESGVVTQKSGTRGCVRRARFVAAHSAARSVDPARWLSAPMAETSTRPHSSTTRSPSSGGSNDRAGAPRARPDP